MIADRFDRFIVPVVFGAVVAFAPGCGAGSGGDAQSAPSPSTPPEARADAGIGPDAAVVMGNPSPPALDDDQIAAIASTADKGEIEQAKLAQATSKDPGVKRFAAMMIAHHTDNQKKTAALLQKEKITPRDNPVSTQLATDSSKLVDTLKSQQGKDFDRAYVDAQVKEHGAVLDMLDNKLIPSARDAEFKAALQAFRPTVADHLKAAQTLQHDIGSKGP